MCGLVGMAGDIAKADKDAFRMLLHLDIIRGPHSTGVASVKVNGEWDLVKKKGNAWDLFDSKEFNSLMTSPSYALIGHNRYATKGKVNNINAHPFEFQDVVGAHNGTIRGQWRLPENQQFEVDSENIFYAVQEEGLEETLSKLDGAYALTYWDKRTDEMVLLRNSERTLFYCFSACRGTVYWASERWMLSVALSRAGIKYEEILDVAAGFIYRFKFDRAYKPKHDVEVHIEAFEEFVPPKKSGAVGFNTGSKAGSTTEKKPQTYLPGKTSRVAPADVIGKVADFVVNGEGLTNIKQPYISGELVADTSIEVRLFFLKGSRAWQDIMAVSHDTVFSGKMVSWNNNERCLTVDYNSVEEVIEDDEGEEPDTVQGYGNRLLAAEEFKRLTAKGCAWCTEQVTLLDAKHIQWLREGEFICPSCKDLPEVQEVVGQL